MMSDLNVARSADAGNGVLMKSAPCPECGALLGADKSGRCSRCGFSASDDIQNVKVIDAAHLENSFERDYDALLRKIQIGAEDESVRLDFIADMEDKSDCGDARAQCFLASRVYDEKTNPKAAFGLAKAAADSGDHRGELLLGSFYGRGVGTDCDRDAATRLYRQSALQGNPQAMVNLGIRYMKGDSVKQDLSKADQYLTLALDKDVKTAWMDCTPEEAANEYPTRLRWAGQDPSKVLAVHYWGVRSKCPAELSLASLERAVELGSAEAMSYLGICLQFGYLGAEKDAKRAVELYRKASERGDVIGTRHLGLAYFEGVGVEKDMSVGARLVGEAAERGEVESQYDYSRMLSFGWGVSRDRALGIAWLRKSAEGGKSLAIGELGRLLVSGDGVEQDVEKGLDCLERSARAGEIWAWRYLGELFILGDYVPVDYVRACAYLRRGADADDGESCNNLSLLLERGLGCQRNEKDARSLLKKAIELGSGAAMFRLGDIYGERGDNLSALSWYQRAADEGFARGKYKVALAYWRGEGVNQDADRAVQLAEEAVREGAEDTEGLVSARPL